MAQFEQGIGYHIHYVRLDIPTTIQVKAEAARLKLPVNDVFRRAVAVYFEKIGEATGAPSGMPSALDDSGASPAIDNESRLGDGSNVDDGRFNLLGNAGEDKE